MLSSEYSILLIDDDADVLDAYTQLLEQSGYRVFACNNPFEAQTWIQPDWPGIVLSDVCMPGCSGIDLMMLLLEQSGYRVFACNNPFEAQTWIQPDWPGIVLSDVCMPGCSGIDLMMLFHQDDQQIPILLITGHGDVPMAVDAVKKGAWDFLQKPVDPGKLLSLVEEALRQRQSIIARRQYCQQTLQVELIGRSEWINQYRRRLQQLSETDIAVWLYGAPGTGRMTGARYLHQFGRNAQGEFIYRELTPDNAPQLNDFIALAQGGTLVLSHPEHLTREQQYHLVQLQSQQLQSQEHRPFRLIGIGDTSLVELAASNHIIAELYYCFAMTQIACLPLTQRPDDIEPLFRHYLCKACQRLNHPVPEVGKEMLKEMMRRMWPNNVRHPVPEVGKEMLKEMMRRMWPNNVRELANAAELFTVGVLPLAETANPLMHVGTPTPLDRRVEDAERQIITEALNIHQGRINEVGVLPLAETANPLMHVGTPTPLDRRVEDAERQIITEALNIHQGRINEVAEYLQIPRKKLYLRMKKYGLSKEHYKI